MPEIPADIHRYRALPWLNPHAQRTRSCTTTLSLPSHQRISERVPEDPSKIRGRFSTDEGCREYLFQLRWPEGFRCPRCGCGNGSLQGRMPGDFERYSEGRIGYAESVAALDAALAGILPTFIPNDLDEVRSSIAANGESGPDFRSGTAVKGKISAPEGECPN